MRNFNIKIPRKIFFSLVIIFLLCFLGEGIESSSVDRTENQEQEIKKAKLYKDIYPLISEIDLYCSFFVLEQEKLDTKIIGTVKGQERILLREHDIFYINKGEQDGIETGQIFLILERGPKIKNPLARRRLGRLALKRGRAQIIAVEENSASARLERACQQVMEGYFLVPFEEKRGLMGKDLGYEVAPPEGEALEGRIVYLQRGYQRIGSQHWALIDLGERDGLQFGQQLIIYRRLKKRDPLKIIGNLIVIDTQDRTSTVKILSSKDAIQTGDLVRAHFK